MTNGAKCDLCDRAIPPHAHYVVRIDVFADPSTPPLNGVDDDAATTDGGCGELAQLIEQLKSCSAEQLQDQVHRRFEYALCSACHAQFLANPLGLPRRSADAQPGQN